MVKSSSQNHHSRHKFSYSRKRFSCTLWCDILEPNQAEVLARYGEDFYQGRLQLQPITMEMEQYIMLELF